MSDIKILVEQEILGFVDFAGEKGYFLRNDDEHVRITYEILLKLVREYLGEASLED